jgi:hypothetical protein
MKKCLNIVINQASWHELSDVLLKCLQMIHHEEIK